MRLISLALSFLSLVPTLTFGQDNFRKAEKIDSFGVISCEDLRARSQYFASQISNDPFSKALVIVHPMKDRIKAVYGQFRQIRTLFTYYNAEDRLEFLIDNETKEPSWEFWRIPPGAAEPAYEGKKWSLPEPDLTKAFIYDYEDENGICSTFVIPKFVALLNKSPGSRTHIVVYAGDKYSMRSPDFERQWIDTLTKEFGLARNRIKIYYAPGNHGLTYAEFWFVPAKKK